MTTSDRFEGFPAGAESVVVPAALFTRVLPEMSDAAELVVTLYVAAAAQRQRRYPRLVEVESLRGERPLVEALAALLPQEEVDATFRRGLEAAVERGSVLAVAGRKGEAPCALVALNTAADRRAIERVRHGDLVASIPWELLPESTPSAPRPGSAYRLYEAAIGPITPAVAQELAEAEGLYPAEWLAEAFREAELLNRRSWRYVQRILERWDREGRDDAASGRDSRWRPDSRFEHLIRRR